MTDPSKTLTRSITEPSLVPLMTVEHKTPNGDVVRLSRTKSIDSKRANKLASTQETPTARPPLKLSPPSVLRSPTLRPRNQSPASLAQSMPISIKEQEQLDKELQQWIASQPHFGKVREHHSNTFSYASSNHSNHSSGNTSPPPSRANGHQHQHQHQQQGKPQRPKIQRQKSLQVTPFEVHVTIAEDESPSHTPPLSRRLSQPHHAFAQMSLLDTDLEEWPAAGADVLTPPKSSSSGKEIKSSVSASSTFPRNGFNGNSQDCKKLYHLSLPRNFIPAIPPIKPISYSDDDMPKLHESKSTHNISSCASFNSTVRKSIIPDPNHPERASVALYYEDEGKDCVLGGSLLELVNCLTDERADMEFLEDFLYTYRYFTTADYFLDCLQRRYLYAAPIDCTAAEKVIYDEWRGPVQLRVINCLKKWIEDHFHDFENDSPLLDKLRSFILSVISLQNAKWASSLEEVIHAQLIKSMNSGEIPISTEGLQSLEILCAHLRCSDLVQNRKWRLKSYKQCFVGQEAVDWMMLQMGLKSRQIACTLGARLVAHELIFCVSKERNEFRDTQHSFYQFSPRAEAIFSSVLPSTPILPKHHVEMNLANVDPKEIARQLTSIECEIFKSIRLTELCHQSWIKNKAESPHAVLMIRRFNDVGFWAANEVLAQRTITGRTALLKKFIKIAHVCKKMNNFNTMMEIAVGLSMGAVARLAKTWTALDAKSRGRYDDIMRLTHSNHNYRDYREILKNAAVPVLPYLGLYLRDLTFIEDGNSNILDNQQGTINFHKMRMLARVFKSITNYQDHPHNITRVDQLRDYLQKVEPEQNNEELYRLSYKCEMARNSMKIG